MTGATLLAHSTTKRISEKVVKAVAQPEWTNTWHPISHNRIIIAMEKAVDAVGMKAANRQYSMNKTGTLMFGAWDIQNGCAQNERTWAIGLRNGIDRNMSFGIVAGDRVFVCDNLAFSGEVINFRRHTNGFNDDTLAELCTKAVSNLKPHFKAYDEWLGRINSAKLTEKQIKAMIYNMAVEEGVIPIRTIPEIHNSILGENSAPECTLTVGGLHGAVARSVRKSSMFTIHDRSSRVKAYFEGLGY